MSPEHLGSTEDYIKHVFGSQSMLVEMMRTQKAGKRVNEEWRKEGEKNESR